MKHKKISVLLVTAFLMLFMSFSVYAAMDIGELDQKMYDNVNEKIDDLKEDAQADEKEILDAFFAKIQGDLDIDTQSEGYSLIGDIAKDLNLTDTQWKSAYLDACDYYKVPISELREEDKANDLASAVSKLHILQWDADSNGVNMSAMKIMLQDILGNTALNSIMGMCMTMGAALCIAFGIWDIVEKASERSVSTEALWRAFLKMCMGLIIIFNSLYIAAFIIYVGNMLLTTAIDMTTAGDLNNDSAYKAHMALWESLLSLEIAGGVKASKTTGMLSGLITQGINASRVHMDSILANLSGGAGAITSIFGSEIGGFLSTLGGASIISFVISLSVYAIAIDIGIRFVFTPIAIADLFSEKFRSTGVRWLKGIMASSLQGVIIYVIVVVGTTLRETLASGAAISGFAPVTGLAVNLTMIGLFAKSRAFANDIVGTH